MLTSNDHLAFLLAATAVMRDWRDLLEAPAKFTKVTQEDIMRVAKKYLIKANRTVGIVTQPEKPAGPYLTILVMTLPRTPEMEGQIGMMKGAVQNKFPDANVRTDDKNAYIEIGRFELDEKEAATKRLKELLQDPMAQMLPAPPKLITVGAPEEKQEKKETEKPEKPGNAQEK